ncbi:Fc.00g093630.m01.CDS01 [Cosmosporella sp. VM-42]
MPSAIMATSTPPVVVGPSTKKATRPTNKLPQSLIEESQEVERENFDASKHLEFQPPARIYSMKEIGLEGHGVSPNAVSEPFSLFTEEAIKQMRVEIFSEEVLENCQYSSTFNKNMVRGMTTARAPFVYDAWRSPEVLARISEVAGLELVPAIDFDIGNINISINDQTSTEQNMGASDDDQMPAVAWHYDSFPFVCVTMLSDCTGMVGGETAVRLPNGDTMKVRGPAMGTAVVLQGRYIEHQALKAFGGRERITMVTSFRPKSPFVKDETVLTGVRGISDLSEIYSQYTEYRLEILEERIRDRLKAVRQRALAKHQFDTAGVRGFLAEQQKFLESMLMELYEVED